MKTLRVDATPLIRSRLDGISRYAQNLVPNLEGYDIELVGFIDDRVPAAYRARFHRLPLPRRFYSLLYKTVGVPAIGSKDEMMLCLNFVEFPKTRSKTVLFVHDLAYLAEAGSVRARNRRYLQKYVPQSLKRAHAIVTISQATRRKLAKTYGLDESSVAIVPPGIDTGHFKKRASLEIDKVLAKYKLPKAFILFFGTLEPRKNISGSIEAYALLPEALRRDYALVLAGSAGWNNDALHQRIEALKVEGCQILTPGYIDDADAPAVYSAASAFVFPSLEEGFGIPVLEAMACGTPVVAADILVLKETGGQAALYADPKQPKDIAQKLESVLSDHKLAETMVKKGLARVEGFSWQASAEKLQAVLRNL